MLDEHDRDPCGGAAGSVLQRSAMIPERRALLIRVFEPLMTSSSPPRHAAVEKDCRSEPPRGSVGTFVARSSPLSMKGTYLFFCSSVPYITRSLAATVCYPMAPARDMHPREALRSLALVKA